MAIAHTSKNKKVASKPTIPPFDLEIFFNICKKNKILKRNLNKIYEIAAYALVETIIQYLNATGKITLNTKTKRCIIDFGIVDKIFFKFERRNSSIRPVCSCCFNMSDYSRIDSNLQLLSGHHLNVKYIALDGYDVPDNDNCMISENTLVVCKMAEKPKIESVTRQLGLGEKIRGFITETDLIEWYQKCTNTEYESSLGKDVIGALIKEFKLEFPLTTTSEIDKFFKERGYSQIPENTIWSGA